MAKFNVPKIIKSMTNKELLTEAKKMKSGRYKDIRIGKKKYSTLLKQEIAKRKTKGRMKKSAGKRKRRSSWSWF